MKEKKIDEKPKKGRMIMWAFIYSGVFIAALIIGVVSKFVQPSWLSPAARNPPAALRPSPL